MSAPESALRSHDTLPLLRRRLGSGVAWAAIETLAARGAVLVAMIVTARALNATEFGALTIVLGTVTFFGSFVAEGLRVTAAKQVAASVENDVELGRALLLVVIAALASAACTAGALFAAAGLVTEHALQSESLTPHLRMGSLLVLLETISAAQRGVLLGLNAWRSLAMTSLVSGALVLIAITVPGEHLTLDTALQALALSGVVGVVGRWLVIVRVWRARGSSLGKLRREDARILWRFSFPAMLNSITWAPVNWLGMTMLARAPDGFAQLGILGVANQWFAILLFLPNIVANAALPLMSKAHATRSDETLRHVLNMSIRGNAAVATAAAAVLIIGSPWILALYGAAYSSAAPVLIIAAVTAIAASTLNLLGYVFAARERMWTAFGTGCVWAVLYLSVAYPAVHAGWGALGIATAMACAYGGKLIVQLWLLRGERA